MNNNTSFWINECLIDSELNRITYHSETQSVEPRVMSVLVVLFESAGRVVARDELINKVWGNRVTSDSSLSRNIALLRRLLDKSEQPQSCIKTVPKKGYMLLESCATQPVVSIQILDEETIENAKDVHSARSLVNKKSLLICFSLILISLFIWLFLPFSQSNTLQINKSSPFLIQEGLTVSPQEPEAAFCFDGLDDYIEIPTRSGIDIAKGDFSLSAWIKTETQGTAVILDKRLEQRSGDVLGYNFHILRGEVGMQLADGDGIWRCLDDPTISSCTNFYSGAKVADNQWHFVAVTIDRDNHEGLKFYVDGHLVRTHNPTIRKGSLSNEQPLRVGSRSSSKSAFFPGYIGEVKIYRYALNSEAIGRQFLLGNQRSCGTKN